MKAFISKSFRFFLYASLLIFALASVYVAFDTKIYQSVDCQIEGSSFLLQGKSPYAVYSVNREQFRYSRIPTHLPQSFYILAPFSIMGDKWSFMMYGIVGIVLLFLMKKTKPRNKDYLLLVFALLASHPFRNNIGNGQFLFFFFSIFMLFDHLVTNYKKNIFDYLIAPMLLVALFSKPTAFFWILLFYPINKRFLRIYSIAFIVQLLVIWFFTLQTGTTLSEFIVDYFHILMKHGSLTSSIQSVFSISFFTILQSISSIFVLLNLLIFIFLFYRKFILKIEIQRSFWMFTCIVFSFILVYHRNYDSFMLLLPLFIMDENSFQKRNVPILCLLAYMIGQKLIFKFIPVESLQLTVNNFFIVLITSVIHLSYLFRSMVLVTDPPKE